MEGPSHAFRGACVAGSTLLPGTFARMPTVLPILCALALQSIPPARLYPPPPPPDVDALAATDPAKDPAAARRLLAENGITAERRRAAAGALAAVSGRTPCAEVADAIAACNGTCGATRDLADLLVSMSADVAKDPATLALVSGWARDAAAAGHVAARRTIAAIPADARPEGLKDAVVRKVPLRTVPGAMQYDVKEIRAKPGELLEISLENADTIQHNLLLVAPGKMSEVGVAADKMGETADGKARQFIPDLPSVLAVMGLVDPGRTGTMFVAVPTKPGTYAYVCTYPGHWRMMNGKLKVAP